MRRGTVSLLEVSDLKFGYSSEPIFESVSFRLDAGERASLVAPNGAGKSTLLRIIAGELSPDSGALVVKKGASVGYCRQSHELTDRGTLRDALFRGFADLVDLRRELAAAQQQAASGTAADLSRLADLTDRYHHVGADQLERRIETIASRLGFSPQDMARKVTSLSGGERGRLQLGVVLAASPDLLLLDEPTNHLDLAIGWLEPYLAAYKGAVLLVSHDRAFLDAVCPITLELEKSTLHSYRLPYSQYQVARVDDLQRERKAAQLQAAQVARTEEFIRRNLAAQKTKQAQSRRRQLDKLQRLERPTDVWAAADRIGFRFAEAPRSGDLVLDAQGLAATRGGSVLFEAFSMLVRRGNRVGIVGRNGCGKSTLLALLAKRGAATDRSRVRCGTNLHAGYFDQHLGTLAPERTGVEEIRSVRGDLNVEEARQYLARFRFYGDDPLRKTKSLSGGEHTRLALAKLLLEPRNLLFLDEPTNDLDIPATLVLEEALSGFTGTVIVVSHDRKFLQNVTTRTISFCSHGLDLYEGGFSDYMQMLARRRAVQLAAAADPPEQGQASADRDVAPSGAERHRARRAAARALERKQRRVQDLEAAIEAGEQKLSALRQRLSAPPDDDWERLHKWATREQHVSHEVERLMTEWMRLSEELAEQQPTTQEPSK